MRTCDKCGCYLPDGWEECPACGLMTYETKPEEMTELQYAFHLLRSMKPFDGNVPVEERSRAFEIVDVNTADGRTMHFPVPTPRAYPEKTITELSHELRLAGMGYGGGGGSCHAMDLTICSLRNYVPLGELLTAGFRRD